MSKEIFFVYINKNKKSFSFSFFFEIHLILTLEENLKLYSSYSKKSARWIRK